MQPLKLITIIEDHVSKILAQEYNNEQAFLRIDNINYAFLDAASYCYELLLTVSNGQKAVSFKFEEAIGLPSNIFAFTKTQADTLSILIANYAVAVLDLPEPSEDTLDEFNEGDDFNKYMA